MSERWRDKKGEPGFVFQPWMKTVDELEDQIADLVEALKQVRPYSRHIPARVLECIDSALAKAEAQS